VAKQKINDGHYLELMDRLAVQTDVLHDYVYEHPLTDHLPKAKKRIETALTNLYEAYQLVGNAEYKQTKKK
jgi:hypothetical protein